MLASWSDGNLKASQQLVAYARQGALTGEDAVSYLPRERGLEFWDYRRRQERFKQQFSGRADAALLLVRRKRQNEAFRLLAWQTADAVLPIPPRDFVRIVARVSIFGLMPKNVEMVVPRAKVVEKLSGLTYPLSGDEDILVVNADKMPAATRRLTSLGGPSLIDYERVRPDHCIEVPLN